MSSVGFEATDVAATTQSSAVPPQQDAGVAAATGHADLAIAAASLTKASETFIHDHIRTIAPGRTIVLTEREEERRKAGLPGVGDLPFLPPKDGGLGQLFARARYARELMLGGMSADAEARVVDVLVQSGVKAVMAEYLNVGVRFIRAAERAGVPLYVHAHGFDASQLPTEWRWRTRFRTLFKHAEGIIVPSAFLGRKLTDLGCPEEKIHVSACGVDPERFRPSTREPGRVLAVGWMRAKKAPHHTVAAFARVHEQLPDTELHMVGDGDLLGECRRLATELGCTGAVHFHGAQPSEFVADQMQRTALFVQHSVVGPEGDTEGLPVAVLEAMTSEVPVVSTRHAGIPEAVIEGETGLLVDEHDVAGMAEAMKTILTDPERGARMGVAGRARVLDGFTAQHTQDRLRRIMNLPAPSV